MSLPKLITNRYSCKLPVSGKKVDFRPFLAKEEKVLLMAAESKNSAEAFSAMGEAINGCTDGSVDIGQLCSIDMEWLFTNIRAKSVGESFDFSHKCTKCEGKVDVSINLDEIKVEGLEAFNASKKIQITNNVGVILKPPSGSLSVRFDEQVTQAEMLFAIIIDSIEYIYDSEQMYKTSEVSEAELMEFVESLPSNSLKDISETIHKAPKMVAHKDVKCPKCGTSNEIHIEGMGSFFS